MEGMTTVFLEKCDTYSYDKITCFIDKVANPMGVGGRLSGAKVLLKPNLISGSGSGLACTNPHFVLCVAQWLIDNGADVSLGDSPAFGNSDRVLRKLGIYDQLRKMNVSLVDFSEKSEVVLACGVSVGIATAVQESDIFINLPKIKAHSQMYVTIAMKNMFGIISGIRKPLLHMQHGGGHGQFAKIIVDLLEQLPENYSVVDGIEVMHKTGPIDGESLSLGCLAAGRNPIALDTGVMTLLGLEHRRNPLLVEANQQGLEGADEETIVYPFLGPEAFRESKFEAPDELSPIRFSVLHFLKGQVKRFALKLAG
jgi:uncharacterized protein (DUF362 family)